MFILFWKEVCVYFWGKNRAWSLTLKFCWKRRWRRMMHGGGDIWSRVATSSVYLCRKKQDHVGDLTSLGSILRGLISFINFRYIFSLQNHTSIMPHFKWSLLGINKGGYYPFKSSFHIISNTQIILKIKKNNKRLFFLKEHRIQWMLNVVGSEKKKSNA